MLTKISLVFWSIWRHQKDISKLTDLNQGSLNNARLTRSKMAKSSNKWWNILWSFFRLNNLNEQEFPNRPITPAIIMRRPLVSMTSLLTHTVAHSTRPSFRPKINNQPLKKFLSLAVRQLSKSCQKWQNSDIQSQFSMSKIIRIFQKMFFIEEYDFRGTLFVIDIFWKLHFLNHFTF